VERLILILPPAGRWLGYLERGPHTLFYSSDSLPFIYRCCNLAMEIDNHFILPDLRSPSDHTPLTVDIFISEEFIQDK